MTDRIEMLSRLGTPDAINADGHKPGSPTGHLVTGQIEARMQMDRYAGERNRIFLDDTFSEKGTKSNVLKLAADVVTQLQIILKQRSKAADARIAHLDKDLQIVSGDDPDLGDVRWVWDILRVMNQSDRSQAIIKAFDADHKATMFAALNWPPILGSVNPDPRWIEALKNEYGKAKNPLVADEFATLTANRDRLRETIKQAILEISNDSGLGENTLRDRMNDANDLIKETEVHRAESVDDQLSGKNVRSPNTPNTPVTA